MSDYLTYPNQSKVWIYQSNKQLDADETAYLKVQLDDFICTWESHGQMLTATTEIFYNLFVVFFVDEEGDTMCGRAKDASVRLMMKLEEELEMKFLDRMVQSYKNGETVEVVKMNDFTSLLENNIITEDTIVFNNMVATKAEFDTNWEVPMKESWHKQFLTIS